MKNKELSPFAASRFILNFILDLREFACNDGRNLAHPLLLILSTIHRFIRHTHLYTKMSTSVIARVTLLIKFVYNIFFSILNLRHILVGL